jgi:hypothetical protein
MKKNALSAIVSLLITKKNASVTQELPTNARQKHIV